jgi:ribokinase
MAGRIPKVVVVGSAYVDIAIKCDVFPAAGETVRGSGFSCLPGGSGVNSSVQAALCGCETYFIGKVGDDLFGRMTLGALDEKGVNTEYAYTAQAISSGAVVTMVDSIGENSSCISEGANRALSVDEVGCATVEQLIGSADVCLICGDVPVESICTIIKLAKVYNTKTILQTKLNALQASEITSLNWPGEFFFVDVLIPDFHDVANISEPGTGDSHELKFVASELVARGIGCVLIKMGSRGCFIVDRYGATLVEGFEGEKFGQGIGGDAFAGAIAASCGSGDEPKRAVRFAQAADALTAGKFGSIDALPSKRKIIELLQKSSD